ncbi:hypothetical protein [Kutzneria sp. CA-103260]|uniref:hypothetical protein n=1 Tax=Kutzneria sp. CA-103260 TaxID=2802641 RepID=UPI001BA5CC3F|nr:hypothetical protein [Kutzneria sp. CA-103260]QUQ64533.1 cytochrome P450 [Kutzneria sp. CA-103260]
MRAGEPVLSAKHAAKTDRRRYADPDHYLGAPQARMHIQIALAALLARFPDLRLAVPETEVVWKSGLAVRGPVALPITW